MPVREVVIFTGVYLFGKLMKPIEYEQFLRRYTGVLVRIAECCADMVLPKLS